MASTGDTQKVFNHCISNRNSQYVLDALENGVVTPDTVYQQFSLLHIAAANGRYAVVKDLINRGCDVNRKGSVSYST